MKTSLILAAIVLSIASPAEARCLMSYCRAAGAAGEVRRDNGTVTLPAPGERWAITNPSRQRQGDIYNPGAGRRIQIRDNSRQVIAYIERDGTVTNTSRRVIAGIELD